MPRWKVCARRVGFNRYSKGLTVAATSLYARKYFPKKDKEEVERIMKDVKKAFKKRLENVGWMDENTRKKALKKLKYMQYTAGYVDDVLKPDLLNNFFKDLDMTGSYLENTMGVQKLWLRHQYEKRLKPIDKSHFTELQFGAYVNAFFVPWHNQFILLAGILQGNIFNPLLPNYINYGAIGVIVGHEITHGFDNHGRANDFEGNLVNWWDPKTDQEFKDRAQCFIDQFGNYKSQQVCMNLNGEMTQSENIADDGGLKIAYLAYSKILLIYCHTHVRGVHPPPHNSNILTATNRGQNFNTIYI